MHVLYFHQHFSTPAGSSGTRSYEMAQKLLEQGHQVTMVCGAFKGANTGLKDSDHNGVKKGNVDGIDVIEFDFPYSNHDGFLKRSFTFLRFSLAGVQVAFQTDYDLLFATSTPLTVGIPGILMRVLKRKKSFVFEVRDLWPELPREMGVITNPVVLFGLEVLEWLSYHCADHCIALSPGIAQGIESKGIQPENISMIPNGCDLDLFQPSETEETLSIEGVREGDFVAVFTGAHGMANGLEALLDAAVELKKRKADQIKLVLIGDGKCKPELQERAQKEQLDNCIFLDPMPKTKLAQMITNADVGLMLLKNCPAFYYGTSPNKFFDYISCGLPILNNYPGWLADLIREAGCGKAVAPDDPKSFAQALIDLSEEKKQKGMKSMKQKARKLAEEHFDRKKLSEAFVNVLTNVFQKKKK